ncbi:DUF393 domain-containing protein [bacterium]|nr:DUF393 domain-containing protein [bacterium]
MHSLLFDGNCKLCCALSKIISNLKRSDQLCLQTLQDYFENDQKIPLQELNEEIHLVSNEQVFKGHLALIELTRFLKGLHFFYPVLKIYPVTKMIQFLYFLMKSYRSQSKACKVK